MLSNLKFTVAQAVCCAMLACLQNQVYKFHFSFVFEWYCYINLTYLGWASAGAGLYR